MKVSVFFDFYRQILKNYVICRHCAPISGLVSGLRALSMYHLLIYISHLDRFINHIYYITYFPTPYHYPHYYLRYHYRAYYIPGLLYTYKAYYLLERVCAGRLLKK